MNWAGLIAFLTVLPAVAASTPATSIAFAASTSAAMAAEAAASSTAPAIGFWAGFVHVDGASAELAAIERRDCLFAVFVVSHLDETETARAAGLAIGQNADTVDLAITLKGLP